MLFWREPSELWLEIVVTDTTIIILVNSSLIVALVVVLSPTVGCYLGYHLGGDSLRLKAVYQTHRFVVIGGGRCLCARPR